MSDWRRDPSALYSQADEEAVIGGLLLWPGKLHEFELRADEFYLPETKRAYEAILSLTFDRGGGVDALTVADELKRQGHPLPDEKRLGEMAARAFTGELIPRYAQAIRLYSLRRKVLLTLAEQQTRIATCDLEQMIGEIESMQRAVVASAGVRGKMQTIATVFDTMLARIRSQASGASVARLKTHIRAIDEIIGGMPYGHPTMLGGRPSNCKTALARTILDNVAVSGFPAGYISLEDDPADLVQWQCLRRARVGIDRVIQETITTAEIDRIADLRPEVTKLPLTYCHEGALTAPQICQRIRQMVASSGIRLVVVDYLQLIPLAGEKTQAEEYAEAVKMIVGVCAEANIALLFLSQLNREVEREKRRPQLSDFKGCGGVEEQAEVAILCHYEWKMRQNPNKPRHYNLLEAVVAKMKQGRPRTARCFIEGALGYVCDPEPGWFIFDRDSPENSMTGAVPFCSVKGCEEFALWGETRCGLHHNPTAGAWFAGEPSPVTASERPRYVED